MSKFITLTMPSNVDDMNDEELQTQNIYALFGVKFNKIDGSCDYAIIQEEIEKPHDDLTVSISEYMLTLESKVLQNVQQRYQNVLVGVSDISIVSVSEILKTQYSNMAWLTT